MWNFLGSVFLRLITGGYRWRAAVTASEAAAANLILAAASLIQADASLIQAASSLILVIRFLVTGVSGTTRILAPLS
jgi:hypothetical protein